MLFRFLRYPLKFHVINYISTVAQIRITGYFEKQKIFYHAHIHIYIYTHIYKCTNVLTINHTGLLKINLSFIYCVKFCVIKVIFTKNKSSRFFDNFSTNLNF